MNLEIPYGFRQPTQEEKSKFMPPLHTYVDYFGEWEMWATPYDWPPGECIIPKDCILAPPCKDCHEPADVFRKVDIGLYFIACPENMQEHELGPYGFSVEEAIDLYMNKEKYELTDTEYGR